MNEQENFVYDDDSVQAFVEKLDGVVQQFESCDYSVNIKKFDNTIISLYEVDIRNYVNRVRNGIDHSISEMKGLQHIISQLRETYKELSNIVQGAINQLSDGTDVSITNSSNLEDSSYSSNSTGSSYSSSASSFSGPVSNLNLSDGAVEISSDSLVNDTENTLDGSETISIENKVNDVNDIDVESMIMSSLTTFGVTKESIDGIRKIENYDEYDYIVLMKNQDPDGIWDPDGIKAYYVKDGKVVGMLAGNDIYTSVEDGKLVLDESKTAPTGIITASAVSATVVGNGNTVIEKSDIINNDGKSENSIVGDELSKDRKGTDVKNVNTEEKNNQGADKNEDVNSTSSSSKSSKPNDTKQSSSSSNTKSVPKTSRVTPKNSDNNSSSSTNNSSSVVNVLDGNVINTDKPIYNGTKYNYSDDDLAYLGYVAQEEQGSVEGAKLELSLMANLYEENKNHFSSVTDYVQNSGWFAYGSTSGYSYPGDSYVAAAREVLNEGKRYLAPNVVEHDYLGDLIYCSTGDIDDKSSYIPGKTVLENQWGARYVFVGFAPNGGDPFGYLIN